MTTYYEVTRYIGTYIAANWKYLIVQIEKVGSRDLVRASLSKLQMDGRLGCAEM